MLDLGRCELQYKGNELLRDSGARRSSGPAFKRIYQIFGASYPGECMPPANGGKDGTYVLSWPGVAFTFPISHSDWSPTIKDHVSFLSSHAAGPASHMAIFDGNSWPEARRDLFAKAPAHPRNQALTSKQHSSVPAEIEQANLHGEGRIGLIRCPPASSFCITLSETTPQDLVTELGPPDAVHKRADGAPVEKTSHVRAGSMSRPISNGRGSLPSSYSSTGTDSYDTDFDSEDAEDDPAERVHRESWWSYFSHGFDILVGPPSEISPAFPGSDTDSSPKTPMSTSPHLVATKLVIHGNVPGSYAFNRHRRLRWTVNIPSAKLDSETDFDSIKASLLCAFKNVWPAEEMERGRVVNRTWSGSPSDSNFFMPDQEEDLVEGAGSEQWLGNTRLFSFPGLVFEVLEGGAVSAVTVS